MNVASIAGLVGVSDRSIYNASKHGLIGLTRTPAGEWGGRGVRVNAVCPGLTASEGVMASPHAKAFEFVEMLQAIKGHGKPDDIAPAVAFLASEEAQWITGQTVNVDAGMVRW